MLSQFFSKKMKHILTTFLALFIMNTSSSQSIYDIYINTIDGKEIKMNEFQDKYILIVNVASNCGYTSQYSAMQKLHDKYDNLVVLGVPCNQFGMQEPGSEKEIQTFCESKYNIDFPMTEKIDVKGSNQHNLYEWLTSKRTNSIDDYTVSWNFNKFLISPKGELLSYYKSGVDPMDDSITNLIK